MDTEAAEPKIDQFHFVVVNEHILKLNVPVDDVPIVNVDQRLQQLGCYISHLRNRKRVVVLYVLEKRLVACEFYN